MYSSRPKSDMLLWGILTRRNPQDRGTAESQASGLTYKKTRSRISKLEILMFTSYSTVLCHIRMRYELRAWQSNLQLSRWAKLQQWNFEASEMTNKTKNLFEPKRTGRNQLKLCVRTIGHRIYNDLWKERRQNWTAQKIVIWL